MLIYEDRTSYYLNYSRDAFILSRSIDPVSKTCGRILNLILRFYEVGLDPFQQAFGLNNP
jgi:hypothetical protein